MVALSVLATQSTPGGVTPLSDSSRYRPDTSAGDRTQVAAFSLMDTLDDATKN